MSEKDIIKIAAQFLDAGGYIVIEGIYLQKVCAPPPNPCNNCGFLPKKDSLICRICIQTDYRHLGENKRYRLEEVTKEEILNDSKRNIIWKIK